MTHRHLLLLTAALCAGPARAEPATCFESWSEAARVVSTESLATVEDLSRHVQDQKLGRLERSTLCQAGAEFRYRLVIRTPAGDLSGLTVDARRPWGR
jgi:hypothetical protein